MGDVVDFPGYTFLDIDPEKMGEGTDWSQFDHVMVVGFNHEGELYLASNKSSIPEMCYLLSLANRELLG